MSWTSPAPFDVAAMRAFPYAYRFQAAESVALLEQAVDDSYRQKSTMVELRGEARYIPHRFHFAGFRSDPADYPIAARLLLTRATDGLLRQRALRTVLEENSLVTAPFVALLAAEYVVQIAQDITDAIPRLDHSVYAEFVRENRGLMRILRERAISYWACYYRSVYPDRGQYPGLKAIHAFDAWAG